MEKKGITNERNAISLSLSLQMSHRKRYPNLSYLPLSMAILVGTSPIVTHGVMRVIVCIVHHHPGLPWRGTSETIGTTGHGRKVITRRATDGDDGLSEKLGLPLRPVRRGRAGLSRIFCPCV
ncbi:hypothetical protein L228DRAFT_167444 [Xylona heveae TC161]|uniref:Uncharacterized protein n=1 Tax=Xylona heveae (strain CBS 132557 / TC161) TaxID=1328760 RepID=A0A165FMM4_XYLHT|nr:hypothetical protein L228DRAFT_167444 [Xylona heveae TC161]KZF21161.1 hypothetical protein L228DRAFT_167444 [Xylona heveae TC161]